MYCSELLQDAQKRMWRTTSQTAKRGSEKMLPAERRQAAGVSLSGKNPWHSPQQIRRQFGVFRQRIRAMQFHGDTRSLT